MGWLKRQAQQPSSYKGAGVLAGVLTLVYGPDGAEIIVSALGMVFAAWEVLRNEDK